MQTSFSTFSCTTEIFVIDSVCVIIQYLYMDTVFGMTTSKEWHPNENSVYSGEIPIDLMFFECVFNVSSEPGVPIPGGVEGSAFWKVHLTRFMSFDHGRNQNAELFPRQKCKLQTVTFV